MTKKERFEELHKEISQDGKIIYAGTLLERAAKNWPQNTAIICGEQKINYKDLYSRASNLSVELKQYGLSKNDRAILFYENSIEFYVGYYGIWQTGAVVAALNIFLGQKELEHIIKDCSPKIIITSSTLVEKVNLAFESLKSSGLQGELPKIITDLTHLENKEFPQNFEVTKLEPEEMSALLYTSGTTGMPKGVMLSSKNIMTNMVQGSSLLDVTPSDSVYGALPLFHALMQNSCVWGAVYVGGTTILVPKIDRRNLIDGLKQKPTIIIAVPALFGLFCMMKNLDFKQVKYFFCGGDALPDKIRMYFALIYGRKINNGYGLTETSPLIAVDTDDYIGPTDTVGYPAYGIECQIRDENNNVLNDGHIGVLWVKGDNIMLGYYSAKEATEKVLQNGWFNTGDLARFDKSGKIVLAGREKDLIVNKGLKIYPQEVENVLMSHPSVFKVGVVGQKVDETEIPVAFIATKEKDLEKLKRELQDMCTRNLANYKHPRNYIFKDDLASTATGKIDKKALRQEL